MVYQIEQFLNVKTKIKYINKGKQLNFDLEKINQYLEIIEKKKGKGVKYFQYLLNKYYSK